MAAMTNTFQFRVPFDEADGEGIVFFGNYFRLVHRAFELFMPELGIPWDEWFKNPVWGVPLRHVEADYLKPLKPGMIFTVTIHVTDIGDSSVHFAYEMKDERGETCARLKTSHVFVTRQPMKKTPIPDSIRVRLMKAKA